VSEVTEVDGIVEVTESAESAESVEVVEPAGGPGDDDAADPADETAEGADAEDGDDAREADEEAGEGAAKQPKAKLSPNLTGKQRRFLRAKAHHLTAVLHVGHEGVTDAVVKQCRVQLQAHELIKVKVAEMAPAGRQGTAGELAEKTGSDLAQVLGRTFLLWKKRAKDSKINLPAK
jgi:RNA-binding protein